MMNPSSVESRLVKRQIEKKGMKGNQKTILNMGGNGVKSKYKWKYFTCRGVYIFFRKWHELDWMMRVKGVVCLSR